MVSRTSKDKGVITFEDFAADIERRRRATDIADLPRNDGNRRTDSKRALLDAIARTGKVW